MTPSHAALPPSPWVQRFAGLIRPEGRVLDLACGSGRHLRWLAQQGFMVTGVDRDATALAGLADLKGQVRLICADVEGGPWPLAGERFDAVVITHYLWRPLWPQVLANLNEGGLYLHETFAAGNETVGRPARADFLLQPGELLQVCAALRIVAYEDGFLDAPARFVQRVAAVREPADHGTPVRRPLG